MKSVSTLIAAAVATAIFGLGVATPAAADNERWGQGNGFPHHRFEGNVQNWVPPWLAGQYLDRRRFDGRDFDNRRFNPWQFDRRVFETPYGFVQRRPGAGVHGLHFGHQGKKFKHKGKRKKLHAKKRQRRLERRTDGRRNFFVWQNPYQNNWWNWQQNR